MHHSFVPKICTLFRCLIPALPYHSRICTQRKANLPETVQNSPLGKFILARQWIEHVKKEIRHHTYTQFLIISREGRYNPSSPVAVVVVDTGYTRTHTHIQRDMIWGTSNGSAAIIENFSPHGSAATAAAFEHLLVIELYILIDHRLPEFHT